MQNLDDAFLKIVQQQNEAGKTASKGLSIVRSLPIDRIALINDALHSNKVLKRHMKTLHY